MTVWRVIVRYKPGFTDHRGQTLEKEWRAAKSGALKGVRTGQAYELTGSLAETDARRLAEKLLADPVTQRADVFAVGKESISKGVRRAEVWPKDGVTDPVGDTVVLAARDLNVAGLEKARSGAVYEFGGNPPVKRVRHFCEEHLMNALVQRAEIV